MKFKIVPNFFSVVMILILGGALIRQFDFENLTFEQPALTIVYFIAFVLSIGFMIKRSKY
ncbi:hypothetical protein [Robiginitalea sp.]|uniref:hypothetical protein n=1 Tax=Robiginitalea sp. TaxID=1902411 RepID=UPI003C738016